MPHGKDTCVPASPRAPEPPALAIEVAPPQLDLPKGIYRTRYGTYEVKWREGAGKGKQRSETFKGLEDDWDSYGQGALSFKLELDRRLAAGKRILRPQDSPELEAFALRVIAGWTDLEERTLRGYLDCLRVHVFPFLGHRSLLELRPRLLAEWQEQRLDEGAGRVQLGKAQSILSRILRKAVVPYEYLDQDPLAELDLPAHRAKGTRTLTALQVESIRAWYLEKGDIGSAALVSCLAWIGLRPQTILALDWSDLFDNPPIWVRAQSEGAGGLFALFRLDDKGVRKPGSKTSDKTQSYVYLPEPVFADLDDWRQASGAGDSGLIWPRRKDGNPWTKTDYLNWCARSVKKEGQQRPKCFKAAVEAFGLGDNVTPYTLRHTAASHYAACGWQLAEIARQLQHSVKTCAERYQHLIDACPPDTSKPIDGFIREARAEIARELLAEEAREDIALRRAGSRHLGLSRELVVA